MRMAIVFWSRFDNTVDTQMWLKFDQCFFDGFRIAADFIYRNYTETRSRRANELCLFSLRNGMIDVFDDTRVIYLLC